ncbi:Uncharacterized membrane protein [Paraburkholderia lycopersici]|uniref:Uncharacterized membrane protein n=2 Tax=Paraburkholderia lycopersici TaxID=416944 RepID=A0A1G7BFV9_9BURK|nr:Uncharacterized membrane protein [Paraburkholderia lycopersici]
MQSLADLAALSASQEVSTEANCEAAKLAATTVASPSGNRLPRGGTVSVTCGVWVPQSGGAKPLFTPTAGDPTNGQCDDLSSGTAAGQSANGVCVTVSEPVQGYFRAGMQISASAIAKSTPVDTFTLTTSLATLNGGLVNQLLSTLLGGGNSLSLSALDYQGLSQVNLSLAGILANLSVGSTTTVMNGSVTIGQLANAELLAAGQQGLADVNLNVLKAIVAAVGLNGGPTISPGSLISAVTATGSSAVDVSVNALAFLSTALQVANGTNTVSIPSLTVQTPTALAPLLNATVTGSVSLAGTPPAIVSGPPGPIGCSTTNCTTNTSTAQGQVFLDVKLSLLSTCADGSLVYSGNACANGSESRSLAAVNLPVTVYLAPATAGLSSVECNRGTKSATVNVQTGVLAAYIGGSSSAPASINLNAPSGFTPDGNSIPLASVNLQGLLSFLNLGGLATDLTSILNILTLGLLNLSNISVNISLKTGQMTVPVANQTPTALTFTYPVSASSTPPNPTAPYALGVGTDQFLAPVVQGIVNSGLTISLSASGGLASVLSGVQNSILEALTGPLLTALGQTLVPLLLQPVDSLLTSITGLLGLSLGNAYVINTPDSIKCGNPMLVQ